MVRFGALIAVSVCCLVGVAEAQKEVVPRPTTPHSQGVPPTARTARPVVLVCPPKVVTNVVPADVKPPWTQASATVVLFSAEVLPGSGGRATLECGYKAVAANNYATSVLTTHAPPNACVVAADQKSFACIQG